MAKKVVWTERAWIDLETVADFIERDSPYYAASFVREIRSHARRLSRFKTFEGSGHVWHLVFGARRSNLTNLDNFISLK